MDIGKVVEIGVREIPVWKPTPDLTPAAPEPKREVVPVTPEREEA